MKLVIAVVQDKDHARLRKALTAAKIQSTRLSTTGSFLRNGNSTFMMGIEDEVLPELLAIIKENSQARHEFISTAIATSMLGELPEQPIEVAVGGATVFIMPMDQMVHF
ncbi:cyclic-di-AMP receptor [Bombilactobacillus thymidiniphilus]|uniref:Cyclic-di-AMP receptor n=1 Tax=Bombilactobacillus thymidiniphilus TaxID=2923363 RepID=A0ABY4PEK1_9LACO|nr:cyclic-di-AMP receptor [Bombilactobacillus thymidiniphilus]UQS83931.1 cyclic-di-AMP receptor [Bombilactobacillus thymidiniphilus]